MRTKKQDRAAAGELLSSAGAAKGGAARAEKLTPEERQAIARVGALERHGKLVRLRFTDLDYNRGAHEIQGQMWCRCRFELGRSGEAPIEGGVVVLGNMLLRDPKGIGATSPLPDWAEMRTIELAAEDYRRHVVDTRVIAPPGLRPATVSGTLPNAARFSVERVYEFAANDGGWELVRWR